jgi:hypothetical protein
MTRRFFTAVDKLWTPLGVEPIHLQLIGSTALFLQTDYERGTKDSDVIRTANLDATIATRLEAIAGRNTTLHQRHQMYIDIVSSGIPFLPHPATWHSVTLELSHFRLSVLDALDVVVSKLKPFRQSDIDDIVAMVQLELVPHEALLARFESAVAYFALDARAADELPKYIRNLNEIERDVLGVDESEIELPPWL